MADGLSGIASGVDTSAIVEKLMAIERQGHTRASNGRTQLQATETGLKDVQTRLANVKSAAAGLRAASLWTDVQTVESSDAARIGVTRVSGAGPGGYGVEVTRLASAAQRTFTYTPSALPPPDGHGEAPQGPVRGHGVGARPVAGDASLAERADRRPGLNTLVRRSITGL